MLKACGQVFGQTKEDMDELYEVLNSAGYDFAYITPQNATIVKEVQTLVEVTNGQSQN